MDTLVSRSHADGFRPESTVGDCPPLSKLELTAHPGFVTHDSSLWNIRTLLEKAPAQTELFYLFVWLWGTSFAVLCKMSLYFKGKYF